MKKNDTVNSDSHTPVTMLTECENVINSLFGEFKEFEKDIPIPESEKFAKSKGLNFIKLYEKKVVKKTNAISSQFTWIWLIKLIEII